MTAGYRRGGAVIPVVLVLIGMVEVFERKGEAWASSRKTHVRNMVDQQKKFGYRREG
jgi:hypothetical protein